MRKTKSNVRFEQVNIAEIKSAEYQRPINAAHVQDMTRTYDKRNFDPIVVSEREDGTLVLIDGQHRVTMCKALGIRAVMARIITGLSNEEEAELFLDLNGFSGQRKKIKPGEIFNAKLVAKDDAATEIKAIVEKHGFKFGNASGEVQAHNTLMKLHKKHGQESLDRTFKIIRNAWGIQRMITHNAIIEGVTTFIVTYGKDKAYSDEAFASALSKTTPGEIVKTIRYDATSRVQTVKELNAMLNVFNFNKKKNIIDNIHFNMR